MHGLANWLHHKEPSASQTNAAVYEVQCKQKIKAAMARWPQFGPCVEALKLSGCTYGEIVQMIGVADKQIAFTKGTRPPESRCYQPTWRNRLPQSK
jgi:hypothetical protein